MNRIDRESEVWVEPLIKEFEVSVETIRRDLRFLESRGIVKRVYGGAIKHDKSARNIPYSVRQNLHYSQKEAIALESVKLLEAGDCIFIEGTTTCIVMARHIPSDLELTVVTNSIHVAYHLQSSRSRVFLVGGELNEGGMAMGPQLQQEIIKYRFDKTFFSTGAVNVKGCFCTKPENRHLIITLAEISTSLILLADSSKINRSAFLFALDLNRLDHIITDQDVPRSFLDATASADCKIVIANK
ncbi:MAG: putative transcriptional regulator [Paenibacillus sp.]|jgi:DeoR/GlpR family transcriptional regulator of sugar metabolism|nr:putative transcriptional regulator [Paenibacillus sp.]